MPNSPLQPDDEVDLGLGRDVEVTGLSGLPLKSDLLLLLGGVLLDVLVRSLEDGLSLGLLGLSRQRVHKTAISSGMVQPRKMVD